MVSWLTPFFDLSTLALPMSDFPNWTPAAQAKLKNIPFFVRAQARKRIEDVAREQDADAITADIVEQVRLEFGQ